MTDTKRAFKGRSALSSLLRGLVLPTAGPTPLFLLLPAAGGLWLGAIHPPLHRVSEPDQLAHRQRRQDESVGEDVLPPSAEEPGSLL